MVLQASGQPLTDREISLVGRGSRLVYGSTGPANVVLPALAASLIMPSVTIDSIPPGIVIGRVIGAFQWRKGVDSSGALNSVFGNQQIRVRVDTPGTFRNTITIASGSLEHVGNASEGGMFLWGDSDISAEVVGVGTYEFQWELAAVIAAALTLHDVQTYLILEYT